MDKNLSTGISDTIKLTLPGFWYYILTCTITPWTLLDGNL